MKKGEHLVESFYGNRPIEDGKMTVIKRPVKSQASAPMQRYYCRIKFKCAVSKSIAIIPHSVSRWRRIYYKKNATNKYE